MGTVFIPGIGLGDQSDGRVVGWAVGKILSWAVSRVMHSSFIRSRDIALGDVGTRCTRCGVTLI